MCSSCAARRSVGGPTTSRYRQTAATALGLAATASCQRPRRISMCDGMRTLCPVPGCRLRRRSAEHPPAPDAVRLRAPAPTTATGGKCPLPRSRWLPNLETANCEQPSRTTRTLDGHIEGPADPAGVEAMTVPEGASIGTATLRMARKVAVAVVGVTVVAVGVALIVLPGPAMVVIPLGLAILATEFLWARRLLGRLRDGANRALRRPIAEKKRRHDAGASHPA